MPLTHPAPRGSCALTTSGPIRNKKEASKRDGEMTGLHSLPSAAVLEPCWGPGRALLDSPAHPKGSPSPLNVSKQPVSSSLQLLASYDHLIPDPFAQMTT